MSGGLKLGLVEHFPRTVILPVEQDKNLQSYTL
jgi:hypothetical protein